MITRSIQKEVEYSIKHFPVTVILGARQVGKTTLAFNITSKQKKKTIYLDLENPYDRDKLHDAYSFLDEHKDKLVVIDEIQQMPQLFSMLRSLTDKHRKAGRFLLTGSASPELIKGASQTLAGRAHYLHLAGISLIETNETISVKKHWFRGGFPQLLTAKDDALFAKRADSFITTFIERDLQSLFDVNFTRSVMRNFWQMLAHSNGNIWNAHSFARSLGITAPTVSRYLDFLEGAFMVQKLPSFHFNTRKRIIKAPRIFMCDSGIMHRMLKLSSYSDLPGHPSVGASWEGYVVQQITQCKNNNLEMYYYRTQDGAESDVVLTKAGKPVSCIEIKLNNSPSISHGLYTCIADLKTKKNFVVVPDIQDYRKDSGVTVSGLREFLTQYLPTIK